MSDLPIQLFYRKEPSLCPSTKATNPNTQTPARSGLSSSRSQTRLLPLSSAPWRPKGIYTQVSITHLQPGSRVRQKIYGRIVNYVLSQDKFDNNRLALPQGYHFLTIQDDSGVATVKLHAMGVDTACVLLGRKVTVYASFVAEYPPSLAPIRAPLVSLLIPVHLSEASSSCIRFHDDDGMGSSSSILPSTAGPSSADSLSLASSSCRLPLEFNAEVPSLPLPGLVSLSACLSRRAGCHDEAESDCDSGSSCLWAHGRILVCVGSISSRKTVRSEKRRAGLELVEVGVFDHTASCVLKMWEDKIPSTRSWVPGRTILLINNPKVGRGCKRAYPSSSSFLAWSAEEERDGEPPKAAATDISLGIRSTVNVDPVFPDAEWLRQMATTRTARDAAVVDFPAGVWDVEEAINGPERILFTIADLDEYVREDANLSFCGKLSLLILDLRLVDHRRRNMLCCATCRVCGSSIYRNGPSGPCNRCGAEATLTLNPRVIGSLADETGCLASGKLVWSDRAWSELLLGDNGQGSWTALTELGAEELRAAEEQLLYARVALTFGWARRVAAGRLCILGVEWY